MTHQDRLLSSFALTALTTLALPACDDVASEDDLELRAAELAEEELAFQHQSVSECAREFAESGEAPQLALATLEACLPNRPALPDDAGLEDEDGVGRGDGVPDDLPTPMDDLPEPDGMGEVPDDVEPGRDDANDGSGGRPDESFDPRDWEPGEPFPNPDFGGCIDELRTCIEHAEGATASACGTNIESCLHAAVDARFSQLFDRLYERCTSSNANPIACEKIAEISDRRAAKDGNDASEDASDASEDASDASEDASDASEDASDASEVGSDASEDGSVISDD